MIEIKDKNGYIIEDGDSFHYDGTNPPVIGTRYGNAIKWGDGMESELEQFWWDDVDSDHSEKIKED